MKDDTALPDAVEKLLALLGGDASEDETSLFYAFLLGDSLNWKLIGCFNAGFLPPPSSKPAEEDRNSALPAPSSSGVKNKESTKTDEQQNTLTKVIHVERQLPSPAVPVPDAAIADNPSIEGSDC